VPQYTIFGKSELRPELSELAAAALKMGRVQIAAVLRCFVLTCHCLAHEQPHNPHAQS
jgi:hypothetical protein